MRATWKDLKELREKLNESFDWDLATSVVSFIDERKGAAIGEGRGGFQWI